MVYKRTNSATEAMSRLDEGKRHLAEGNIFSSIVALREAMDTFIHLKDVHKSDRTRLENALNGFQQKLSVSQEFTDLYGKVYFRDNDFATSYSFLCQLITIKEEDIASVLVNEQINRWLNLDYLSKEDQKTTKLMVSLAEQGELSALRELVAANDGLGSLVLSYYNEAGIRHRTEGNIDKAVTEYKKALSISPKDENLYYNIARARIEIGQKKNAGTAIKKALKIHPEFPEGLKLLKYIQQWSS